MDQEKNQELLKIVAVCMNDSIPEALAMTMFRIVKRAWNGDSDAMGALEYYMDVGQAKVEARMVLGEKIDAKLLVSEMNTDFNKTPDEIIAAWKRKLEERP